MTPGEKVWIRVKPTELVGCVDVLAAAGVDVAGMSLSAMVRCALNILIESALAAGTIPRRDGYDYLNVIAPFKRANLRTKVQVGHTISLAENLRQGEDRTIALGTLPRPRGSVVNGESALVQREGRNRLKGRIQELQFKAANDPANMSPAEFKELRDLKAKAATATREAS